MEINKFDAQYRFLSNFYPSKFTLENKVWLTVEHWYQAHKTQNPQIQETIRNLKTPFSAKKFGKEINIRKDWDRVKLDIMYQGVRAKFDQNYELRMMLMDTDGFDLIEGNTWGDKFWGVCDEEGENNLGKILMRIRDEYKQIFKQTTKRPIQLELKFD